MCWSHVDIALCGVAEEVFYFFLQFRALQINIQHTGANFYSKLDMLTTCDVSNVDVHIA